MSDQRSSLRANEALERSLRDLGAAIAYPTPRADLAAIVGERLRREGEGAVGRLALPRRRLPRFRLALILAAALLVLLAAIVIASVIGLPGVRIVFREGSLSSPAATGSVPPPTLTAPPSGSTTSPRPSGSGAVGSELPLGRAIDVHSLDSSAGRHVLLPQALPRPASAWLDTDHGAPIVTLVWRASTSLPDTRATSSSPPTGIGAILSEIPATIERDYLDKVVGTGGTVERVTVSGHPGYWISGAPHEVILTDATGAPIASTTRLVGSSLLWQGEGLTLRLESRLRRAGAIALAESLR
jgi:hypothetical protein